MDGSDLNERRLNTPLRWASRGIWAVLDQGLFAISNFAVGVLLARSLTPEAFGAYTVAYSALLLIGAAHTAMLTEPMLIFGSAKYAGSFRGYLQVLLHAHWVAAGLGSILLLLAAAGGWLFDLPILATALLGAAVATPFILLSWLLRRACFAQLRPDWAAAGGALYLGVMLSAVYLLARWDALSALLAFVAIGGSSLISGLLLLWWLRSVRSQSSGEFTLTSVLRVHWSYGKWALASSGMFWISANAYFFVLPIVVGLEATAGLRALLNLVMPILHANAALGLLLVPAMVRAWPGRQFERLLLAGIIVFSGGALLYWVLASMYSTWAISWLYDGRYVQYAHLLPIVAILPLTAGIVSVLGSALQALERPDQVFWAHLASAVAVCSVGLWMTFRWGITGAAIGQLLASGTMAAVMVVHVVGQTRRITPAQST